jgi:hypothetical protein
MEKQLNSNQHLTTIFNEVLPIFTTEGIKYFVFGGIGIAGIVGTFFRENEDVDIYVSDTDFSKVESILKALCAEHGAWDADGWSLNYSQLKKTQRPKLDLCIKGKECLSVAPVYERDEAVEFRALDIFTLPKEALIQVQRSVGGFDFFSPPDDILKTLLRNILESYIGRQKSLEECEKYLLDATMVLSQEEQAKYRARVNKK